MKTLILIMTLITFFGCNSDKETNQFVYDVGVEFSIKDSEGNDLLNPDNPNSYNESEIKLFYLINNNTIEVYDENRDSPRNFLVFQKDDNYRIRAFLNASKTEEVPKTYIQWNDANIDTISCEINRSNTFTKIQKVWLNGNLIWSPSSKSEPYFELIK